MTEQVSALRSEQLLASDFASLVDLIAAHARETPDRAAVTVDDRSLSYAEFQRQIDRVAAALQRDGTATGGRVVTVGESSLEHLSVLLGGLRAGAAFAPLPTTATAEQLLRMIGDVQPTHVFLSATQLPRLGALQGTRIVVLEEPAFSAWVGMGDAVPAPVDLQPSQPFNIIYSSGTTGAPKGIVQPHSQRWGQVRRGRVNGFDRSAVSLHATPLCSNTTLMSLTTTLGVGGHAMFLSKFDVPRYLQAASSQRATHTILVPVQYQRLLAHPDFDRHDLSSFRIKINTGAPMTVAIKREILHRWPGKLHDYYGLTEGGVFCLLDAGEFPDKLHTIGRPPAGYDVRIVDGTGQSVPVGEVGEIIGHSATMMDQYFGQPEKTAEIEWFAPDGKRFLRSGDLGRFDADGFIELAGRRKEMIISGGFNVYPKDLEEALMNHPQVSEAAVVGLPSERWGETPVAFIVPHDGMPVDTAALLAAVNAQLGRTQGISELFVLAELPRNAMGKVVKAELLQRRS